MPQLAFFGPERTDARAIKRIGAFMDHGWQVLGFTFHRAHVTRPFTPAWENIHLGTTHVRRYLRRVFSLFRAAVIVWRHRRRIGESQCLYAINFDNALLALWARLVAPGRLPLVVEIADIQPAMTRTGLAARVLRAAERIVLRRAALLVTTSPGFVRNYFHPVQRFAGRVFLLENKVYPAAAMRAAASRHPRRAPEHGGRPWVIGWFGVFRCQRSAELIASLAAALPQHVRFYLRGYPAGIDEEHFRQLMSSQPNIEWPGGYSYPDDLAEIYGRIDWNWCFDFSAAGANSAWLLPNRIYEGGLFRCPALALEGTETARWLADHGAGRSFTEPLEAALCGFFEHLTVAEWLEDVSRGTQLSDDTFCGEPDYAALVAELEKLAPVQQT